MSIPYAVNLGLAISGGVLMIAMLIMIILTVWVWIRVKRYGRLEAYTKLTKGELSMSYALDKLNIPFGAVENGTIDATSVFLAMAELNHEQEKSSDSKS